eukprot:CAMPEP_0177655714 /NCGR_PEP_ID=MMETSP0447-20121125/15134_1 /TAXON_ID=0 /ORGANISM="Stygamoeba regulata, Strain BSH-02190019" /LENGTH=379 /DNA_ID=CAMNT_0019159691 /DNA_START=33 /DNA_END=1172 /DNA_ORIENTATION=+
MTATTKLLFLLLLCAWLGALGRCERVERAASSERGLVLVKENKLTSLLGVAFLRLEASGIAFLSQADPLSVVSDNRMDVVEAPTDFCPSSPNASLQGNPAYPSMCSDADCGFEGMTYDFVSGDRYFAIVETVLTDGVYNGLLCQMDMQYTVQTCQLLTDYAFSTSNKGYEGVAVVRYNGELFLFLLCEGNHCTSGAKGREGGGGRIHVYQQQQQQSGATNSSSVLFAKIDTVKLPSSLNFEDYSGIDVYGNTLLVTSQSSSLFWVGTLAAKDENDFYVRDDGYVYYFPRTDTGSLLYCNVEGVAVMRPHDALFTVAQPPEEEDPRLVIGDALLGMSSDKSKSDQSSSCVEKDMMVHTFRLPFASSPSFSSSSSSFSSRE